MIADNSPVASATYALIVANLVASLWALFFDRDFLNQFAFHVGAVTRQGQHYRVFTSSFLHNDLFHLAFNMWALFLFGPAIEMRLGKTGFLVVYFGAILVSGILSWYFNRRDLNYSSVGASDAVSGILFSFILFYPFSTLMIFPLLLPIPAWLFGILFLIISSLLINADNRRVAHEGHLGGALAGLVLTALMVPTAFMQYF